MQHLFRGRNVALALSCAMLLPLFAAGTAKATTDNAFRYSSPKTGFLTFPAAAFVPGTLTSNYTNSGGELTPETTDPTCWFAPVNVAQGAILETLVMWYVRRVNTDLALIQLIRRELANGSEVGLASLSAPATGGPYSRASTPIFASLQIVDNARYVYFLRVCLEYNGAGTEPSFQGARITYTYNNAGD